MHDDAMQGSHCRKILDTKSYLAASGYRLTGDGSRLLESVLAQQGPFSAEKSRLMRPGGCIDYLQK